MVEALVKAGNPALPRLDGLGGPPLLRYMHTSPHTMCFGFPFSSSSFVKVVVAVEWIIFPPPPPSPPLFVDVLLFARGGEGERRKEIPFSSAKPVVVRLGCLFFCWERREILGVGRCRLTSRAQKGIKFPERTFGKMLHLCSAQSFFSGVGSGSFACKICLNGEQFWAVKRKEKEGLIWPSVIRTAQWAGGDFFVGAALVGRKSSSFSFPCVSRW